MVVEGGEVGPVAVAGLVEGEGEVILYTQDVMSRDLVIMLLTRFILCDMVMVWETA